MNKKDYCNLDNSYLLEIDQSEKQRFENNHTNEKQKFINNSGNKDISRGVILPNSKLEFKNNNVEMDSYLRYPPNLYQNKTSVELKSKLDHNKFDLLYSNRMQENPLPKELEERKRDKQSKPMTIINDKPYIGAGRGIGDLDISEMIRTGQDTRRNNDVYREQQESSVTHRFNYLDKNLQDPKNIVMEIPRGGVQTRKNKKLNEQIKSKINFKY